MKVLYDTILKAKYTGRPNRFVVTLDLNGHHKEVSENAAV